MHFVKENKCLMHGTSLFFLTQHVTFKQKFIFQRHKIFDVSFIYIYTPSI